MLEESDRRKYVELIIMEQYLMVAQETDDIYSQINMVEKGEEEIYKYDLNGRAAELIRHKYQVAQDRLEELMVAPFYLEVC